MIMPGLMDDLSELEQYDQYMSQALPPNEPTPALAKTLETHAAQ